MIKIQTNDIWQYVNKEAESYLSCFKFEFAETEVKGKGYWYRSVPTAKDKNKRRWINTSSWKKANWKLIKRKNKTVCCCC
jgi:hypothetical protein